MAPLILEELVVLDQTDEKPNAALIFLHGATVYDQPFVHNDGSKIVPHNPIVNQTVEIQVHFHTNKLFGTSYGLSDVEFVVLRCVSCYGNEAQTGHDVKENFQKYLNADGHPYIKCYFPTAPERYFTIRAMCQRYWFDVTRTGRAIDEVSCSIRDADDVTDMLEKLVSEIEESGIPRERIIIGGVSQGGMAVMYAAYVRALRVGGVIAMAAPFAFYKQVAVVNGSTTPLLSIYGLKDVVLKPSVMKETVQLFCYKKVPVTAKNFQHLGHDLDVEYTKCMFEWMEHLLHRNS